MLTPRFYTTDFDEMERLFKGEWNSRLNQEEMEAMLAEFRYDYNQKHFVRNDSFKKAAENIRGPARKIFIEFLERSCTAEFSGFLLYKELGRRLKSINPVVAEIFTLMSRDEARHAGFLNKAMSGARPRRSGQGISGTRRQLLRPRPDDRRHAAATRHARHARVGTPQTRRLRPVRSAQRWQLARPGTLLCVGHTHKSISKHCPQPLTLTALLSCLADFDLALDLGFLTKNRTYTFFKPKFIIYATYLSEKIGYWRYISIYRHLQANPNEQLYPIFQYFENWCQDENRHGDFFSAMLKSQPDMLAGWEGALWSKFFCLSVYVTMYLNDHGRSSFYESLGLDTTQFNMHVLHQTNKTTATIFPEVIDTYNPEFKRRLDALVVLNTKLIKEGKTMNPLEKASVLAGFAIHLAGLFFMPTIKAGSVDLAPPTQQAAYVY